MTGEGSAPHYPIFVDLQGRLVVVLGGGLAAEKKVKSLSRCGADVLVIAPETTDGLRQLEADGRVTLELREYERGDLAEAVLVVCAGVPEHVAQAAYVEAEGKGCLINVSGKPGLSNYLVPSGVRRGPLQIAVSTRGEAPVLAKRLRARLRDEFGEEWGGYVTLLGQLRTLATQRFGAEGRDRVLEAAADSDLLERIAAGEQLDPHAVLDEFAWAADPTAAERPADAPADTDPEE